ncbi:hypothetical protein B0T19DRAFT_396632 [Cercophora scortea]|uniref:Uncharacterized protein n=1 Tax=Cercophora scortea TaxID=314031 RepID=A0AAE0J4Y4_9PEZI|nr:hypothetical protein B0T19DRAFT_396632 [Cercophora scortea]
MMLKMPDNGLILESSAKAMAGLPTLAFGITLSDRDIEDMIACVQNGQDIQLSLGGNPTLCFNDQEVRISNSPDSFDYDLFYTDAATPLLVNKLPNPTMSIFTAPKYKPRAPKASRISKLEKTGSADKAVARAPTRPNISTPKPASGSDKDVGVDDAIASLKSSYAKVEADRRENSYGSPGTADGFLEANSDFSTVLIDAVTSNKGRGKSSTSRLLGSQVNTPRSLPASPALSGIRSPSLAPTSNPVQDQAKQQRFPIIHELAVQDLTFEDLFSKYDGPEQEFTASLNKVADLISSSQKWSLKKIYWKELDVFEYEYAHEEDRQRAIDNAVRQFDKVMRLGASDPLWQKLLPKAERGKGKCLSKLQPAIAKGPSTATPKGSGSKADASSLSGGDSDMDDSASSVAKTSKGSEPMSRSNSQKAANKKKLSASEAQAKRLLINSKKPNATASTPVSTKGSPKASPTKSTSKAVPAKSGKFKSKEYISESDSDSEAPLSKAKSSAAPPPSKPVERLEKPKAAEKPKIAEKPKAVEKPKVPERLKVAEKTKVVGRVGAAEKPNVAEKLKVVDKQKDIMALKRKLSPVPREREKASDTIRTQPTKPATKRPRDADDDDSSSSGTPLSKRIKPVSKPQGVPAAVSVKQRHSSEASQNGRGNASSVSAAKSKNTSPFKSSPLSSPPTNASDLEQDRPTISRGRERERDRDRDTVISSASSRAGSSEDGSADSRKRSGDDSSSSMGRAAKRQRLPLEILNKAHRFKLFYSSYETLHKQLVAVDNPKETELERLMEMHIRLSELKQEIYKKAPVDA